MMETEDILGDVDINLDDVIRTISKQKVEGAAYIKSDQYAYYPSLNKFACAICVSMLEGDEAKAKEHVSSCAVKIHLADEKDKIFCSICWRLMNKENARDHFFSVGHSDVAARMDANNSERAVWLLKGGVTFTKPKNDSDGDYLAFAVLSHYQRKAQVSSAFEYERNHILQLKHQIENAIRAARGNSSTVSAKLAGNSALVATLRAVANQMTIGIIPCVKHQNSGDVEFTHAIAALHEILKSSSEQLLSTSQSKVSKCTVCGEGLTVMNHPKQAYQAIFRIIDVILGNQVAAKVDSPAKRHMEEADQPAKK